NAALGPADGRRRIGWQREVERQDLAMIAIQNGSEDDRCFFAVVAGRRDAADGLPAQFAAAVRVRHVWRGGVHEPLQEEHHAIAPGKVSLGIATRELVARALFALLRALAQREGASRTLGCSAGACLLPALHELHDGAVVALVQRNIE